MTFYIGAANTPARSFPRRVLTGLYCLKQPSLQANRPTSLFEASVMGHCRFMDINTNPLLIDEKT